MIAPPELRQRQQWLLWRFEPNPKKPDGKKLKVPYYITGKRRMGEQGSEADRRWLSVYHAVVDELSRSRSTPRPYDGVGFAFLPDDGLVGIDLDHVVDEATGEISARAVEIVKACASYTEWSPSRRGLHIICRGDTAAIFGGKRQSFKNNAIGVEVFCGSQYFTFTAEHYGGSPPDVAEIPEKVLRRLHATVEQAKGRDNAARRSGAAAPMDERAKVESALAVLLPDCGYDEWIQVGMAIHAALGEGGFAVWDYWSAKGSKYPGRKDLEAHWKSFKPGGGITAGTLFKLAKDAGWRPPRGAGAPRSARSRGGDPSPAGSAGNAQPPAGGEGAGEGDPPAEGLPLIRWRQGFLRVCVDEAEKALLEGEDRIFQRTGSLVRVVRLPAASSRSFRREDPGVLGFQVVDQADLVETFTASARWEKYDGRTDSWRRINCPEQAAATYLSRRGRWRLPPILSAISAPTLRPDGTVLQEPGYDERMAAWYDPGPVKFPAVPESPTKEDAERALKVLMEPFATFPFCSPADRSVLASMVLTSLVRRSIAHAPLGAFTAPTSSSGKTLLADCVSVIATGARAPAMTYPETDEEAGKIALSVLMAGDPIVLIDNIERPLEGAWLCTILTSETYRQRVLGRSEMISVPSASLWLATGNNLVLAGDLRTRSLICRIDAQSEHPEQRQFTEDIKASLALRRPELVAAGLTVMRAFIATGQRVADFVKPWGRFETWSDMVRAPLVWLGEADPCATIASIEREDPERGDLLRMLTAWREAFGSEPRKVSEAVKLASDTMLTEAGRMLKDELAAFAMDKGGALNTRKAAKWISNKVERRIEGMRFVRGIEQDHVQTYRVSLDGERVHSASLGKGGGATKT